MAAARSIPASVTRLAAAGRSNTLGLSRLALEEVHATLDAADSRVLSLTLGLEFLRSRPLPARDGGSEAR